MKNTTIFKSGVGFSIELETTNEWKLEPRGTHKGLPLYESIEGRVIAIAIVESPAIKENAIGDDSDQTLTGPVMIPNQKIFRTIGPNGFEKCYWYFSEQTIKKFQNEFKGKIKIGH